MPKQGQPAERYEPPAWIPKRDPDPQYDVVAVHVRDPREPSGYRISYRKQKHFRPMQ